MRAADPSSGLKRLQRVPTQRHHERGLEHRELAAQEGRAGRDFRWLRVAVARRPALDDVGYKHFGALPADGIQQLVEQSAGSAHERSPFAVLVEARPLTNKDDLGFGMTFARHCARALRVQRAARTYVDFGCDLLE